MSRLLPALLLVFIPVLRAADPTPAAPAPKLYAVTITTGPGWDGQKAPNEQKFFKEHSANLARMRAESTLVLGGRYAEKGLLLMRAPDEAAVRAQLAQDPSITAGTFQALIEEFRPFYHGNTKPDAASPEIAAVRAQLAAFNQHNPEGVAAMLAPAVKWLSLDAEKLSVDGDGRDAMLTWLTGYFKSYPDVRSEISEVTQNGPFVSFRERASWTAKDGSRRSQQSLAVAEVRDGLIARVWYYPAIRDPAPAPAQKQ